MYVSLVCTVYYCMLEVFGDVIFVSVADQVSSTGFYVHCKCLLAYLLTYVRGGFVA